MKGNQQKAIQKTGGSRCSAEILFEGIPVPGCGEVFTDRHVIMPVFGMDVKGRGVAAALSEERASAAPGQASGLLPRLPAL